MAKVSCASSSTSSSPSERGAARHLCVGAALTVALASSAPIAAHAAGAATSSVTVTATVATAPRLAPLTLVRLVRTPPPEPAATTGAGRGRRDPRRTDGAQQLGRDDRRAAPEPGVNEVIDDDDRHHDRRAPTSRQRGPDPLDAFARFGACTATHIGQGYFLTAGHCVDQQPGFVGFRPRPCGAPIELRTGKTGTCRVLAYRFDAKNDHALVALDDPTLATGLPHWSVDYGFDWPKEKKRWIQLYGYSGGQLRVNFGCTGRWDGKRGRVLHDCDTEGGDSGSALVDAINGQIIGVHGGALPGRRSNYGFSIAQIPWAESLCVSVASSERLPLVPGGAPAVFRLSTKGLGDELQRLVIDLRGSASKRHLAIEVFGPDASTKVDAASITWERSGGFTWRDLYSLSARREGPWSVEVSLADRRAKKGYVDGRIWVCP